MEAVFIALDIGGTKLIVAAADENGTILRRERATTPLHLDEGLRLLDRMIETVAGGGPVLGIGAAAGGPLDWRTGVVSPLHQPEWRNIPLKRMMEEKWRCRFSVDVDTNVAALAEYEHSKEGAKRLLYLTVSTGMGGGFVIDGEIYRGMDGGHPEAGHQTIDYRCPEGSRPIACSCGASSCLEALISGNGIRKIYGKPAPQLTSEEWREVGWNLGQGLRNLAVIYLPDIIVLGGGVVFGAREKLLGPAVAVMGEHLKIVPHPRVLCSSLGEENVLKGAILLSIRARNSP